MTMFGLVFWSRSWVSHKDPGYFLARWLFQELCSSLWVCILWGCLIFQGQFAAQGRELVSNSLDTKWLITWRPYVVKHLVRLLLRFCFDWEDISNTRDCVSSAIQTPWIWSKNTPLCDKLSTFSMFRYLDETLALVFDVLNTIYMILILFQMRKPNSPWGSCFETVQWS